MTADPWSAFLATRRATATTAAERALLEFAQEMAGLADCCARNRWEGPTINRSWLVQRIRDALTALTDPPKENHR
ncbi:hypothetical protein ACFY4C_20480 [Actinomadura viridis]|uniref:hypothetical protein n=1 Tax=Actinomadura viridis TaxID=58110 RepID=UPI0036CB8E38